MGTSNAKAPDGQGSRRSARASSTVSTRAWNTGCDDDGHPRLSARATGIIEILIQYLLFRGTHVELGSAKGIVMDEDNTTPSIEDNKDEDRTSGGDEIDLLPS
ncbi:hypothetical protein MPUL_05390 [Mycolicibacterium pulveris]|uniref:Uncharacterized protein n=1 Tax=Mycolicibacterium pulveris TaxID=36813 RepID=A0A7I7UEV7_MYCPV|nr:hypothetical protein MPUL_05390 [Mycolicibacterium pulveris]